MLPPEAAEENVGSPTATGAEVVGLPAPIPEWQRRILASAAGRARASEAARIIAQATAALNPTQAQNLIACAHCGRPLTAA